MPEEKYKICQSNNARGRNLKYVKALTPAGICDKVLLLQEYQKEYQAQYQRKLSTHENTRRPEGMYDKH